MTVKEQFDRLESLLEEQAIYERTIGKLGFDLQTAVPPEGMDQAGADMAFLGTELHRLRHSPEYQELVKACFEKRGELPPLQAKLAEYLYEDYEKEKNVGAELAYQIDLDRNLAYSRWLNAKAAADFTLFRDSLKKNIENMRALIRLRDRAYPTGYDACLDDYEKGNTIARTDAFFAALEERIVPLLRAIRRSKKKIRTDFLTRPCPIPMQETFSERLLDLEGLRREARVLRTTEHPFTTHFGRGDVRVTTHYYEKFFLSNIFSVLHEGGHALFMQNEPEEFYQLHLHDHMTSAMHECISRFYENLIGRSAAFIHYIYPILLECTGDLFRDVSERELYEAVNIAHLPQPIRIEADELTYPLHIAVRYELEKAFVNGAITADEVPALWNRKYRELLGVTVKNDAEGCLQDVHWTDYFGYFPSYALGNAYGAQIMHTMQKEFNVTESVAKGDLKPVLGWLKERVFSIGSILEPEEWITRITGEPLNVRYYLDYLETKFREIYEL